jgi:hypothetical protein
LFSTLLISRRHKVGGSRSLLDAPDRDFWLGAAAEDKVLELLVVTLAEGIVAADLAVIVDVIGLEVRCLWVVEFLVGVGVLVLVAVFLLVVFIFAALL